MNDRDRIVHEATRIAPSAEGRALLQARVAAFAATFGTLNLVGLIGRVALLTAYRDELFFISNRMIALQAAAAFSLLGIWAFTWRGVRSARAIRAAETLGLLLTSSFYGLLALEMTRVVVRSAPFDALRSQPDLWLVAVASTVTSFVGVSFVLTYAMVVRAAFVPTSARHTALLTAFVGAPLMAFGYLAGHATSALSLPALEPRLVALLGVLQWSLTVMVCTAVSRVIYGLHEEVREARRLGQYTLQKLIGEGGMGMVYEASHTMLRRPTAVKLLPPDRAGREALERFEREVQITAQLTHPNTVTIFDYGRTEDGVLYYAMELLEGATLQEVVDVSGSQPPARVARVLEQVAGALGEAHGVGLIHRDIKPANIVLCPRGGELDVAMVVDFGLVKEVDAHGPDVSQETSISGTPLYMAPEMLVLANAASARSDIYALGAVAYFLLTGEHVFGGHTVIEVLGHHLHTPPEPPSERLGDALPKDLERLVLDCLAKDPADRPQDARELRERLEACQGIGRWPQRSAALWWDAHAPVLAARRSEVAERRQISGTTLVVDLVQRE